MMPDFVLTVTRTRHASAALPAITAALHGDSTLSLHASASGYRLSAAPRLPILPLGRSGHVIGTIFARGSQTRKTTFTNAEVAAIHASRGHWLVDHCWGGWLAILDDDSLDGTAIIRDASPALPVFYAAAEGHDHFTNAGHRLISAGVARPVLDPDYARQILAWPGLQTARVGIRGISELLPGQRFRRAADTPITSLWSPWNFPGADQAITDRATAIDLVRRETLACVAAWARYCEKPLLELSGGLDSSIIAAALRQGRIAADAVTFATAARDGDERHFARIVAGHTGLALHEATISQGASPLTGARPPTLRPGTHPTLSGIDAVFSEHANAIGADAFLSGTGGDNIFCYISTASPLLDVIGSPRPRSPIFWTLQDLARLHETTAWHVARSAWRRARRRAPLWRHADDMITADAAAIERDPHPWLDVPTGTLPGKLDHVRALLRIQAVLHTNDRSTVRPMHYPLLSQPLVEACLRIPTWRWIENGRDRSVARAAFDDLLPEAVLARRTKGRLEHQSMQLYLANRETIRDLLLTGWLAAQDIADRRAIERYTADDSPPRDDGYYRLFDLVGVELWARAWLD